MSKFAVIGNPVKHSLSPAMHNAMYTKLGLDHHYEARFLEENELETFFSEMKESELKGINVTVPFKETVIPFLDEVEPHAQKIGAVNTIVNKDGWLKGYNTDGIGFLYALEKESDIDLANKTIIVIGAGGAAKAIVYALARLNLANLTILNRTLEKAETLKKRCDKPDMIGAISFDTPYLDKILSKADVVINTTSVGLNEGESPLENYNWIREGHVCVDIIYNPPVTTFLNESQLRGATIMNGAGMLAAQGMYAFELFTDEKADYTVMKESLEA